MNESDRKFFLKNFFSFNVSSSVNSSFNNEANNDLDEEVDEENTSLNKSSTRVVDNHHHSETNNFSSKLRINSLNEMKKASFEESIKLIEAPPSSSTTTTTIQPVTSSSVISMPDSISETPTTTEANENNKMRKQLKRQSKKVSQNHVETVEFRDLSQTNSLKQSQSQSPPLIQISNCRDDEKLISHAKTNNIHLLQQQQSIELKPFKKKEVHISDSLEIDHYMSQSSEEKNLLNGINFSNNNSLSANYDSLSNSFNNSIKSDISRFNTTATTLTTLSSTEDVNLKNSQNTNANNNNNNTSNDDSFMIKNSVELMGQRPASNLALFEKSLTDSQNVYIKQMNSFLNSPSASTRLSLTPKFISIRYRLEVAFLIESSIYFYYFI